MLNTNSREGGVRQPPKVYPGANISRKYRMQRVKAREILRLKRVVPSVAGRKKVSQVEVVEEAANYIDQLHLMLTQRIEAYQDFQKKQNGNSTGTKIQMPSFPIHPDILLNLKKSFNSALRPSNSTPNSAKNPSPHSTKNSITKFALNSTNVPLSRLESHLAKKKNSPFPGSSSTPMRTNQIQNFNTKILDPVGENLFSDKNIFPGIYSKH